MIFYHTRYVLEKQERKREHGDNGRGDGDDGDDGGGDGGDGDDGSGDDDVVVVMIC